MAGDFLTDALVGTVQVGVGQIFLDDAAHLPLPQEQSLVQAFPLEAANTASGFTLCNPEGVVPKPLTISIGFRGLVGGSQFVDL